MTRQPNKTPVFKPQNIVDLDNDTNAILQEMTQAPVGINFEKVVSTLDYLRSSIYKGWEHLDELSSGVMGNSLVSKSILAGLEQAIVDQSLLNPLRKLTYIPTTTLHALRPYASEFIDTLLTTRRCQNSELELSSLYNHTINGNLYVTYKLNTNKSAAIQSVKPSLDTILGRKYFQPQEGKIFVEVGIDDAIVHIIANTFKFPIMKTCLWGSNAFNEMAAILHGLSPEDIKPKQRAVTKQYFFAKVFTSKTLNKDQSFNDLVNSMSQTCKDFPTNDKAQGLLKELLELTPWAKKDYETPFGRKLPDAKLEHYVNATLADFEKLFLTNWIHFHPNLKPKAIMDNAFLFELDADFNLKEFSLMVNHRYNMSSPVGWLPVNAYVFEWNDKSETFTFNPPV